MIEVLIDGDQVLEGNLEKTEPNIEIIIIITSYCHASGGYNSIPNWISFYQFQN